MCRFFLRWVSGEPSPELAKSLQPLSPRPEPVPSPCLVHLFVSSAWELLSDTRTCVFCPRWGFFHWSICVGGMKTNCSVLHDPRSETAPQPSPKPGADPPSSLHCCSSSQSLSCVVDQSRIVPRVARGPSVSMSGPEWRPDLLGVWGDPFNLKDEKLSSVFHFSLDTDEAESSERHQSHSCSIAS